VDKAAAQPVTIDLGGVVPHKIDVVAGRPATTSC